MSFLPNISIGAGVPHPENGVLSPEQMAGLITFSMVGALGPQCDSDESYLGTFERVFDAGAPTLDELKRAYLYDCPEEMVEEQMEFWRKIWTRVARALARRRRRDARLPLLLCRRRYYKDDYKQHPEYGVADKIMRQADKLPVNELRSVAARLLAMADAKESPSPIDPTAEAAVVTALAAETDEWIEAERAAAALRPPPPPPPDPLANAVRLEAGTQEHRARVDDIFASMHRAADARDAAARNVIVKLARPFSGEEDLFKHMVSFL